MIRKSAFLLLLVALVAAFASAPASAATETHTYRAGPYTLGGFNVELPKQYVKTPKKDGYVTWMDARLVYANGRQVPIQSVMLHHLVFINAGHKRYSKRTSCPGRSGEPFWGTGEEHQELILPKGMGYHVRAGDRWWMQVMLMSHSVPTRKVYVEYKFRFVTGRKMQRVRPFWLRANGCNPQPSYTVFGGGAPGSEDHKRWAFKMPFNGRIVAAGGHLHGGAKRMYLSEPRCNDRELFDTDPMYAPSYDTVYRIRPILHEPGPVSTRYFLSRTGIPVSKGQNVVVNGIYDAEHARPRVMSILHIYVVPDKKARSTCQPLPKDRRDFFLRKKGRLAPPFDKVPLNVVSANGRTTRAIDELPGPIAALKPGGRVDLIDSAFRPAKISLPVGSRLTWRFRDGIPHNVLLANGPRVVGSPTQTGGQYTTRFSVAGRYQLFCYLHPMTMHQQVDVYSKDDTPEGSVAQAQIVQR